MRWRIDFSKRVSHLLLLSVPRSWWKILILTFKVFLSQLTILKLESDNTSEHPGVSVGWPALTISLHL